MTNSRLLTLDLFASHNQQKLAHLKVSRSALSYDEEKTKNSGFFFSLCHNPTVSDLYNDFFDTEGRITAKKVHHAKVCELRKYGFEIEIEFISDATRLSSGQLSSGADLDDRMMGLFLAYYIAWRMKWMDRETGR